MWIQVFKTHRHNFYIIRIHVRIQTNPKTLLRSFRNPSQILLMVQKNYSCEDTESLKWDNSKMPFPFEIRLVFSFVLFAIYVSFTSQVNKADILYIHKEWKITWEHSRVIDWDFREKEEGKLEEGMMRHPAKITRRQMIHIELTLSLDIFIIWVKE